MRIAWLLVLFVTSCGGSTSSADAAIDLGVPSDGAEAIDAASPDAETADAAQTDATVGSSEGIVLIGWAYLLGEAQGLAEATLSPGALLGGPIATAGGCDIYIAPVEEGLTAGNIAITGANFLRTLLPSGTSPFVDYSPNLPAPADFVTPGQTITATAAGGADIPAFTGSVVVPANVAGFTPPAVIDLSSPPTITWTASTADEMWAWIQSFDESLEDSRLIWCRVPDTGTFTFPSAATSMIPASHSGGFVVLFRTNFTEVTAGPASIAITALVGQGNTEFVSIVP